MAYFIFMKGKATDNHPQTVNQDPKEVLSRIGKKMAGLRKKLGYTNSDSFAYDKGINRAQYGKYEAGSQDMRISTLVKVANKLGLTIEDFFAQKLKK